MTEHTLLHSERGFAMWVEGTGEACVDGQGRSLRASDDELREREVAALRRNLEGLAFRETELVERRRSGKRDLRKSEIESERAAVLARLDELGATEASS